VSGRALCRRIPEPDHPSDDLYATSMPSAENTMSPVQHECVNSLIEDDSDGTDRHDAGTDIEGESDYGLTESG
jgi:hypothetical protein